MYASIRHYQMGTGSMSDLMHKVDTQFADRLSKDLGLLGYQAIDTGNQGIITVTLFATEEECRKAEKAAEGVRENLSEFQVECTAIYTGDVMVHRGSEKIL